MLQHVRENPRNTGSIGVPLAFQDFISHIMPLYTCSHTWGLVFVQSCRTSELGEV